MNLIYKPFEEISHISPTDLKYSTSPESLAAYIRSTPSLSNLYDYAKSKGQKCDRDLLIQVLEAQYESLTNVSASSLENIKSLGNANTFTLITAHQPNLLGGPLYFIYKIASTIKLAQLLNQNYDDINVVPVFVIGGEDHDFDELNHTHLFGKKLEWTDKQGGSVGRYDTTSLSTVLDEYATILGESENANALKSLVIEAYKQHSNYGKATAQMVHNLFGKYGLIVASMDDPNWKRKAISIFKDDLTQHSSYDLVAKQQTAIAGEGLKVQAYVRPINLFYLSENKRERIEESEGQYSLIESGRTFTRTEILQELDVHPERFSPNVILRPLYQELIFPNLAYIGGGGEIAYWLERKTQFQHFEIEFPILVRRDSVLWVNKGLSKKINSLNLSYDDIWLDIDQLTNHYVSSQSEQELNIDDNRNKIIEQLEIIKNTAQKIDPTLGPFLGSEIKKWEKQLQQYESRMRRAEKKKNETAINQLQKLKQSLFPANKLQERYTNFSELYLKQGPGLIEHLIEHLNPLDSNFKILVEQA